MRTATSIYLAVALPCEAKPLVAHFDLKKDTSVHAFEIYRNEKTYLTVTGPGKAAMSAGLAYTQARAGNTQAAVMINVGVAGHQSYEIGSAWTAHKITDLETGRNFYPLPVYGIPCAATSVLTASKPQFDYDHEHLCDMEASAFFETAARFSTCELIQCLKIVSDNKSAPGVRLDPKHVSRLIQDNIGNLQDLFGVLERRARQILPIELPDFERLIRRYRFTASEQMQLKNVLSRLTVLTGNTLETVDTGTIKTGKDLLAALTSRLDDVRYDL